MLRKLLCQLGKHDLSRIICTDPTDGRTTSWCYGCREMIVTIPGWRAVNREMSL